MIAIHQVRFMNLKKLQLMTETVFHAQNTTHTFIFHQFLIQEW